MVPFASASKLRIPLPAGALLLLLLLLAAAGCSMGDERMAMAYVDPAAYRYHSCEQLAEASATASKRQRELDELIVKAQQDRAGALVTAAVYRGEYLSTVGNLRLIEEAEKGKNCQPPEPAHRSVLR